MPPTINITTIEQLEKQTKAFALSNDDLTDIKREMSSEFEAIRAKYIKKIKAAVEKTIQEKTLLSELIDNGKELFVKPKTMTMNSIKIGFQKSKDKIECDDELRTIEIIEKEYTEEEVIDLIKTEKKILKDGIIKLADNEIKKIRCRKVNGQDTVLIKTIDNEVDKFVNALMKESEAE